MIYDNNELCVSFEPLCDKAFTQSYSENYKVSQRKKM